MRILVVEDDRIAGLSVKQLLSAMLKCQVDLAKTGQDALQLTQKKSYDLIFMDIKLGGGDGFEVTKSIKNDVHGQNRETIVVVLTGHQDPKLVKKGLEIGIQAFFIKPLQIEELCQFLKEKSFDFEMI